MNAGGFGYLRERYGLEALNLQVPGLFPQLYGADPELRVLALEDVSAGTVEGEQYSVAHALLEGTEQQALDALNYYIEAYCPLAASGIMGEAVEEYRLNLARADRKAHFPGAIASPGLAERGLKKLYGVADESLSPSPMLTAWIPALPSMRTHPFFPPLLRSCPSVSAAFCSPSSPSVRRYPSSSSSTAARSICSLRAIFSPQNVLVGSADGTQVRMVDAEGTCLHHRGFPFVEAMLGFPSSPEYPRYRVDREGAAGAVLCAVRGRPTG